MMQNSLLNLRTARQRNRLSEHKRFALVVDASPSALLLVSASGHIEMANRQAENVFGYKRKGLVSRKVESLMPERFRTGHNALRENFMAKNGFRKMAEGQVLFGLKGDGSEIPLEISLNPIEVDGEPLVLVAILDITIRHNLELEKEAQRQELERSNHDLEAFAYIASHDLKAPLRAINHLVEWISEDIGATASPIAIDYLKTIKNRTARLQRLLDGLLAYSKIGRASSKPKEVDITELVGQILELAPPPPGFSVICRGPFTRISAHETPLRVVLDNLIANALKHHDRDNGEVTIAMRLENGLAEFRVSDDGPGIKPQFHARIFDIFHTLASQEPVDSTGLGLSIVKKMVQVNGGQVRVESKPPQRGACFIFTWKLAAAKPGTPGSKKPP